MKKFYTLAISLFALQTANAQFTIIESDYTPVVGEAYETVMANGSVAVDLDATGEGLTWDFSSLSGAGDPIVTNILNAAGSEYPTAEFAYEIDGVTSKSYVRADDSGLYVVAQYTEQTTIVYTGGRKLLNFPMSYGDTDVSTYTGTNTNAAGLVFNLTGTVTMTVDAYGDIILPYGTTISNVMRIKAITEYTGVNEDVEIDLNGYETNYFWYHEDYKQTLLNHIIGSFSFGPSEIPIETTVYVTANDIQGLNIDENDKNVLAFYPNPAKDFIQLPSNESIALFEIYNMNGALVKSTVDVSNNQMNVSDLSRGVYFVKYQTAASTYTQKLILQ